MADWMRRLFHQRRDVTVPAPCGQELGFVGLAADVIIDDDYRLAACQTASDSRGRFEAARGWFMKIAKNGERASYDLDDPTIQDAVDAARDDLAEAMVVAAARLRDHLKELTGGGVLGYTAAYDEMTDIPPFELNLSLDLFTDSP